MSDFKQERRYKSRLARVSLVQANSFVIGRTVNLSAGGARIEVFQRLPLQSPVSLDLLLGEHLIEVSARVVYVNRVETDRYHVGLQFEGVDSGTRELLEKFLSEPYESEGPTFELEEQEERGEKTSVLPRFRAPQSFQRFPVGSSESAIPSF